MAANGRIPCHVVTQIIRLYRDPSLSSKLSKLDYIENYIYIMSIVYVQIHCMSFYWHSNVFFTYQWYIHYLGLFLKILHTYQNKNIDDSTTVAVQKVVNEFHVFDRSKSKITLTSPVTRHFALKTRSLTYRIFRTRSKMQILVLKQRLSALGYTHDVNTCSDAEGLASVACTHTPSTNIFYGHMCILVSRIYHGRTKKGTMRCACVSGDSIVFEKRDTRCGKENSQFLLALGLPGALRLKLNRSNLLPRGPSHYRPSNRRASSSLSYLRF